MIFTQYDHKKSNCLLLEEIRFLTAVADFCCLASKKLKKQLPSMVAYSWKLYVDDNIKYSNTRNSKRNISLHIYGWLIGTSAKKVNSYSKI